jgi:hypothetical protein
MANFSALHIASKPSQAGQDSAPEVMRAYDDLFRIFYNSPPQLDSTNIIDAYTQSKTLLSLAEMYDSLKVVGPRVDHHLLQFQGRLWKQIAKYPPSYLKLGYMARSRVIFSEALVHVVGQWPRNTTQLRQMVPPHVLDMIEDKVSDLEDIKAKVDGKLFRCALTTKRGERVSPGNAYPDWLALSLFRQWLVESTTPPPPPPTSRRAGSQPPQQPPPNDGRAYRIIGSYPNSSYLTHEELKQFLKKRPEGEYGREYLRKFEKRIEELKLQAREIARPLMAHNLELDLGEMEGGYLTCTSVDEEDFCWE